MKSVNSVTLLGNVTRDAELKSTKGGQPVCTFGLATNREWRDHDGILQKDAEFHTLVLWGAFAEACARHIKKGKPLYVEGHLKTGSWEGKAKAKMSKTEIVVEEIVFLGAKGEKMPQREVAAAA